MHRVLLPVLLLLFSAVRPTAAQRITDRIMVLPPLAVGLDSTLTADIHDAIRTGTRVYSTQLLIDKEETAERLGSRQVRQILNSRLTLQEFAETSGARFIIGSLAARNDSGFVEISLLLYNALEDEIREVRFGTWERSDVVAGTRELARDLTHPRFYSPADTPFFYSLFIPGLGQFQQGNHAHAALSAGLVAGVLLYQAAIPSPDNYRLKWERYQAQRIFGTNDYLFLIDGRVCAEEDFYAELSEARRHNIRAERERQEAEKRRRRASRMLVGAYVFNLIDTLLLSRRRVDTRTFFLNLEALPASGAGVGGGVRLRLVVPLGTGVIGGSGIPPSRGFPPPGRPPADPSGK